jgi:putative membrane protein
MKIPEQRRRPTAFAVDDLNLLSPDERPAARAMSPSLVEESDPFAADLPAVTPRTSPPRRWRWARLFFSALGGLVTLAVGLAIDNLIRDLFSRTDFLGWLAVALTALAVLALAALAIREVIGLARLRLIDDIRSRAVEAATADDREKARAASRELIALSATRPETARGRAALSGHIGEIIDGRDLIGLAETELLVGLDETARSMVLSSAKRVALLTAVSPRALVDLLFVASEILRLIRRLAALYGGRPGFLGFVRLTRAAITHLAVTGGMAAGDSIVQQFLGHGIAARLSARLGEGVVNGLLTARIGIAAIEVCRPLPFVIGRRPRLSDVMTELARLGGKGENSAVEEPT